MCTVLLPPGVYPIAFKYIMSYHIIYRIVSYLIIYHIISYITSHHTSHITHHTSHITHHTSHITHHTSHITHHTPHTTHHTSHITHITSYHIISHIVSYRNVWGCGIDLYGYERSLPAGNFVHSNKFSAFLKGGGELFCFWATVAFYIGPRPCGVSKTLKNYVDLFRILKKK